MKMPASCVSALRLPHRRGFWEKSVPPGPAIASALHEAQEDKDRTDVVLVIGKGHERWIKDLNRHVPYEGDDCVVERLLQ